MLLLRLVLGRGWHPSQKLPYQPHKDGARVYANAKAKRDADAKMGRLAMHTVCRRRSVVGRNTCKCNKLDLYESWTSPTCPKHTMPAIS